MADSPRAKSGEARAWIAHFMSAFPETDDCIMWPFAKAAKGHAVYRGNSVSRLLLHLEPGDGLVARHLCHTPSCVNPRHLIPGTPKDNSQDMVRAGRHRSGSVNPRRVA